MFYSFYAFQQFLILLFLISSSVIPNSLLDIEYSILDIRLKIAVYKITTLHL